MACLLIVLVPVWVAQTVLAVFCAKRYPAARTAAVVLIVASPVPAVVALLGPSILWALHVPSSFDAPGDGFEILFQCMAFVIGTAWFSAAVCVWLSLCVGNPIDRR